MFDGRDYNQQFDEACANLAYVEDKEEVRGELEHVEWILWEAIRGVFFYAAIIPSGLLVWILSQLLKEEISGFWLFGLSILVLIPLTLTIYWSIRFLFWYEISRHVKGRKFGG